MKPLLTIAAAALLSVTTACGVGETETIDLGASPATLPTSTTAAAPPGAQETAVTLYFTRGDRLEPVRRVVQAADEHDAARLAVEALLRGPTAGERAEKIGSEIPGSTRLLRLQVEDLVAEIDLSREFESGGGSASMTMRLAQVACTLDNVVEGDIADATRFLLDGQPVRVFSSEGIVIDDTVNCADYGDLFRRDETAAPLPGAASASCVNGWSTPAPGTDLRQLPLDLMRTALGVTGRFAVDEMRYFTGPDDVGRRAPRDSEVERWYVKAQLADDPTVRGRFLVVRRSAGQGVVAVAPYATVGFVSPDWAAFEGEGAPVDYADLPGRWGGVRYDFVTGAGGPGTPGLPFEVRGCVSAT